MPLQLYRCPHCGHEVQALAGTVTHPCPKRHGRHIQLKPAPTTDTTRSR